MYQVSKLPAHFISIVYLYVFQIHPMSICTNEFLGEKYDYGWVGVMKLENIYIETHCMTLYQQVSIIMVSSYKLENIYIETHCMTLYQQISIIMVSTNWKISTSKRIA